MGEITQEAALQHTNLDRSVRNLGTEEHTNAYITADRAYQYMRDSGIDNPEEVYRQSRGNRYAISGEGNYIFLDDLYDATHGGNMSTDFDTEGYSELATTLAEASGEITKSQMELASELAEQQIQRNIERAPGVTRMARQLAISQGDDLNAFMEQEFYSSLDRLMPEWREDILGAGLTAQQDITALSRTFSEEILPQATANAALMSEQASRNTMSLLRGEIPEDVMAQIVQQTGEAGQAYGVFGQAGVFRGARDIGRTSLDLMQQGLANAPAALGIAPQAYGQMSQIMGMPMQSAANLTNLMAAYRAPQVDISSLYGQQLGILSGASTVQPTAVMSTAAQVGMNTFGQVSDFSSGMYTSNLNYGLQQQALQMQQQQFRAQQKQQRASGFGSILGGIAGFAFGGGPVGAAIGSQIGGGLGGMFG